MPEPTEYSTDNKILKEGRKRWNFVKECKFEKDYRKQTLKDLNYITGEDQGWDEHGDRAKLQKEDMPALTLNRVAPILRLIMGARPNTEAKFIAVEEGDIETAGILNACKDHIDDINRWDFITEDWFLNGVGLLRGVVEIRPNYDRDIRGEIDLTFHANSFKFYFDPDSTQKDRSDGEYMFVEENIAPEKAKRLWPNKKAKINELTGYVTGQEGGAGTAGRDSGEVDEYADPRANYYNQASNKIKIIYYWYKEHNQQTKIIDLVPDPGTGEHGVFTSPQSVDKAEKALEKLGPEAAGRFKVVSADYVRVKYMTFSHDIIFEEGDTPWDREDGQRTYLSEIFPFICFEPERLFAGTRQELTSIINPLHDPQKFYNKLSSAIIHIIGTTAHSGYDIEKGAVSAAELKRYKKQGSKPGFVGQPEQGKMEGVRQRKPGAPPSGHMMEAAELVKATLDISGVESLISTESLGKGASGKAIDLKQRQGGNIIAWLYKSFRFFQHVLTECIRDAIQVIYDYEKVVRIKGTKTRYVRINEQMYDEVGAVTQVLNDVTAGQYDVVVTEKEILPSVMVENFRLFADLVKSGAMPLPPEVMTKIVVELMDNPDLKEIIENEMGEYMEMMAQQPQPAVAGQAG